MRRITQLLASGVFVITVLSAYLAFDFAINNAISSRTSSTVRKRLAHDHDHLGKYNQVQDGTKNLKQVPQQLPAGFDAQKSNRTNKHQESINEEFGHHPKLREQKRRKPLNAKAAMFHKGKTGIKVNKPNREAKNQRRRGTTTTTTTTAAIRILSDNAPESDGDEQ